LEGCFDQFKNKMQLSGFEANIFRGEKVSHHFLWLKRYSKNTKFYFNGNDLPYRFRADIFANLAVKLSNSNSKNIMVLKSALSPPKAASELLVAEHMAYAVHRKLQRADRI
jgi:hypothetical protein